MNKHGKILSAFAAVTAAAVAACGCNGVTITFDEVMPWHDTAASYEQLQYDAVIYDTTRGDTYVEIAEGSLTFTLTEDYTSSGSVQYTQILMAQDITYNSAAPERDRGKTDTITSSVDFQSSGLAARNMEKTVALADRSGVDNLSYTVTADYSGAHKATITMSGKSREFDIPMGAAYKDNEMMFYLARATKIGAGVTTNFETVNIFDSFNKSEKGKLVNYAMKAVTSATAYSEVYENTDADNWVADFGVEAVTDDDGKVTYPVLCYATEISINATKSGLPYTVYFSQKPFTQDDKSHGKIPVKIVFTEYEGRTMSRITEYRLSGCSFEKPDDESSSD